MDLLVSFHHRNAEPVHLPELPPLSIVFLSVGASVPSDTDGMFRCSGAVKGGKK